MGVKMNVFFDTIVDPIVDIIVDIIKTIIIGFEEMDYNYFEDEKNDVLQFLNADRGEVKKLK